MPKPTRQLAVAGILLATVSPALAAPREHPSGSGPRVIDGTLAVRDYDGRSDDLLSAGLGLAGLAGPTPAVSSPPTAAELRRLAIYSNYRALVDMTPGGGYGRLYGPGVGGGPEKIAGREVEVLVRAPGGRGNITVLVQIPTSFDPAHACIITGPSSGSRGIYGAIATAGEWGLKKGCAVAYTDKGTGVGIHDLARDEVGLEDGIRVPARAAGPRSTFTAPIAETQRRAFDAAFPDRFAVKHAHSQTNPEADWGRDVIRSIDIAFWALNREDDGRRDGPARHRPSLGYANTLVIASSVSNGGGASLRAAEEAPAGMIDGVAVSEPNVNPRYDRGLVIRQGRDAPVAQHSRPLYDYSTILNVYQGCANLGRSYAGPPLNALLAAIQPLAANRCQSLKEAGLLHGATLPALAEEAQTRVNAAGILEEQNFVQPAQWLFGVHQAIAVTYANAYTRSSVRDGLCGYSFAATALTPPFRPVPLATSAATTLFGTANGIPPTGGIDLVANLAAGGPTRDDVAASAGFGRADQNAQGALCLRSLWTGDRATGPQPSQDPRRLGQRLARSIAAIRASGRLHGIPAILVQGRDDGVLAPNHTSRPYYALSRKLDGRDSGIAYYEVLNAQHLDAFNAFPDFAARLVPLHHYFLQALDLMWAHLTEGKPLPPSQVVRTLPRGNVAAPISVARNLPPVAARPAKGDAIRFDGRTLAIPE